MTKTEHEAIRDLLLGSEKPLVLSHERPDGDAIGSLLAMGLVLQSLGKKPYLAMVDGIPARYRFLPGATNVRTELPDDPDLIIVLDCSDQQRIGFKLGREPDINIDHHPTNEQFARINLLDEKAAATTELLYNLFVTLDVPLTTDISTTLLVGLITDTIGFRTPSVHPKLFRIVADLLERGADITELYARALNQRSFTGATYWGRGLSKLERQGDLLWTELSLDDRKAAGYVGNDDADLVNLLTTIESPKIVIIFVEQPEKRVKISWRSKVGYDVSAIATSFGGGGHKQAAGAMISGTLEDVKDKVLSATRDLLEHPEMERE